jgi:hypothetical protein
MEDDSSKESTGFSQESTNSMTGAAKLRGIGLSAIEHNEMREEDSEKNALSYGQLTKDRSRPTYAIT